jgi:hypothetical protein
VRGPARLSTRERPGLLADEGSAWGLQRGDPSWPPQGSALVASYAGAVLPASYRQRTVNRDTPAVTISSALHAPRVLRPLL